MLKREEDIRDAAILAAAEEVLLALRTAPKTRGMDNLSLLVVSGDHKEMLAAKMDEINERLGGTQPRFSRDAKGVVAASAVILVGVKPACYGLDCGWCGFPTCAERAAKNAATPCVFGPIDMGIAAGVAAVKLSEKHIDNRMMFSMGLASLEMGWFEEGVKLALGFPLSATGKNIFFDR